MRSEAVKPGDVIAGKYRVRAILGRTRGTLVDAFHVEFDQRVIARILSPALCDDKQIERFRREARILAKLESEHVARILDFGSLPDGGFYLVRQHLDGTDLATHLRKAGKLPLQQAVHYVLQAAEAVAETHAHNILLRELQPAHLFVAQRLGGAPTIKVIDFGTAKLMRDAAPPGTGDELTATTMFGMSPYSSPELVRKAKVVDARTDVWSLGAILYELLAGRPPFHGEMAALMLQITRDDPPLLASIRRDLPKDLDQIIRWALAKDVDGRFGNVHAFGLALAPFAPPEAQGLVQRIGELTRAAKERRRQALAAQEERRRNANATDADEPETLDPDEADYLLEDDDDEDSDAATQIQDHGSLGITPEMRADLLGGPAAPAPAGNAQPPLDSTVFIGPDFVPPSPAAHGGAPPATQRIGAAPSHAYSPPAAHLPANGGPAAPAPAFGSPPTVPFGQPAPGFGQPAPAFGQPPVQGGPQPANLLGPAPEYNRRPQASHPLLAGAASGLGTGSAVDTGAHRAIAAGRSISRGAVMSIAGATIVLVLLAAFVVIKLGGSDSTMAAAPEEAATEQPSAEPDPSATEPAPTASAAEPEPTTEPTTEPTSEPTPTPAPAPPPPHVAAAPRPHTPPPPTKPPSTPPPKPTATAKPPSGGGMGTLVAVAVGGTCRFSVNGASKGTSSSLRLQLKPGTYSVSCRPATGSTKTKSVRITDGGSAMAMFKLQ